MLGSLILCLSALALANEPGLIEAYVPLLEKNEITVRKVPFWAKFPVEEARFEAVLASVRLSYLGEPAPWGNMNLGGQIGLSPARVELFPKDKCKITMDVARLKVVQPKYFTKPFGREESIRAVLEAFRWNLGLVGVEKCALELQNLKRWPELEKKEFPAELTAAK